MQKYIFTRTENGASPTGYTIDENGKMYFVGFSFDGHTLSPNAEYPAGKILQRPDLAILIQKDQFKAQANKQNLSINNNNNTSQMQHNKMNPAVIPVETASGQLVTGRDETQYSQGGEIITLNVSLDYTTAGGADPQTVDVLIGDGTGIIANRLGLPALPITMVVGGTFGAATLSLLKNFALSDYIRLHTYQGEANTATYWSSGIPAQTIESNIQGSLKTVNIDFNLNQDGSQFNEKIRRVGDFRFILATFTAIKQSLQKGDLVNLTFKAQSVGTSRGMMFAR